ncbi:flagellar basal body rod modification protein [Vibrio azureus]|uniref:Basal-body rod modification protein FlgD n=1 Tax=Vibrio azureus NBRC 104587 TaxID=1219077 RepID=U3ARW7_9VIBR|nr:flagellar hook assembly protein FlgD [Vibrio azureus]AUI88608.1 flagellar basal body rod modification protein [Vibrio azureus]GAD75997.1 flagellar basal body rod modification protein FlgD [Vibrio azureus NBRC 104587]
MSIAPFNALSSEAPSASQSSMPSVSNNPMESNKAASLQNEFISLMVAQIQNQDPLNPLDGTEYVSQLAQFSQVQSTENMSTLMQNSMVSLDNMQVLSTAGLMGKTVYVTANEFNLNQQTQSGKIELAHASNQVTLLVKDAFGQTTKVPLGAKGAGEVPFSIDPEELGLKPGPYSISVEVQEGQASPTVLLAGTVEQVRIPSSGGPTLVNVEGVGQVPFYQITQFGA